MKQPSSQTPGFFARLKSRRSTRKFLRQKLAVAALAIVVVYMLIGLAVLAGAVSVADTEMTVGPRSTPGFFVAQSPEKRLEDGEWMLDRVKRELKSSPDGASLGELAMGKRRVAELPPAEIQAIVGRVDALIDELARSENLDRDASQLPKLAELERTLAELYPPPTGLGAVAQKFYLLLGVDRQGRSILLRALYSTKIALQVGVVTALVSVLLGGLLGASAGYYGGIVDGVVTWLYTTLSSIPNLVLLVLLAYVFTGGALSSLEGGLVPIYVAFCLTFWVGPCRVIRGETLKLKELDYVQAAKAIGLSRPAIVLKYILPSASHLLLINFSLLFILAIKSEVILTFLNLGIKRGASWGIMISHSVTEVVNGFFWQIGAATFFMFVLVLAFNILSDALQDAFDPKHV